MSQGLQFNHWSEWFSAVNNHSRDPSNVLKLRKTCCSWERSVPVASLSVCVSAGYIVKQMGLPLKLVAMVNSNDIVHRAVTTGDFSMAADVTQTLAPAIDIQVRQYVIWFEEVLWYNWMMLAPKPLINNSDFWINTQDCSCGTVGNIRGVLILRNTLWECDEAMDIKPASVF